MHTEREGIGGGVSRPWQVLLVAVLLVGSLAAPALATDAAGPAGPGAGTTTLSGDAAGAESVDSTGAATGTATAADGQTADAAELAQEIDTDRTRIRIDLRASGDGQWTVELWTRLADDADEAAFADLEADVESDPGNYTADFRDRMAGSLASASDATGREMAIENLTVATRTEGVPSSYGVLAYEFTWTNFAAVDGDRLRAGAAIDAFLLEENTRLTIGWPAEYRATTVSPAPDDRTETAAVWRGGETDFLAGEPRVVVTSAPPADDSLLPIAGLVVAVLVALFVLAWLVHSGRLRVPASFGGESDQQPASAGDQSQTANSEGGDATSPPATAAGTADSGDEEHAADASPSPDASAADDTSTAADASAGEPEAGDETDGSAAAAAPDEELPAELLSNEEQVLRLLEAEGGRLKQQQVVAELEWTDAKTSQVVTSMREEGQIEVFRIGRENVLALPGEMDV
ncbi:hypothetical protein GCM10028857_26290 [Salinarchaeum chitinilyticum]